jgi:hypothetical protein
MYSQVFNWYLEIFIANELIKHRNTVKRKLIWRIYFQKRLTLVEQTGVNFQMLTNTS